MRGRYIIPLAVLLAVLTVPVMADTGDSLPDQIELSSTADEIGGTDSVAVPSSSVEESTSAPESSDPAIAESSSVPPDGAGETSTSVPEESSSLPDELPLESEALPDASEPKAVDPTEPPIVDDLTTQQYTLIMVSAYVGVFCAFLLLRGM